MHTQALILLFASLGGLGWALHKIGHYLKQPMEVLATIAVVFSTLWLVIKGLRWTGKTIVNNWRTTLTRITVAAWWRCWSASKALSVRKTAGGTARSDQHPTTGATTERHSGSVRTHAASEIWGGQGWRSPRGAPERCQTKGPGHKTRMSTEVGTDVRTTCPAALSAPAPLKRTASSCQ
jgi:hypothetical protein